MGLDKFIFNLNGKSVDLSKLQGGININSVDKKLASIFRALDIDKSGVIDESEIDLLKKYLLKADIDGNKTIDENELDNINKGNVIDTKEIEQKIDDGEDVSDEEFALYLLEIRVQAFLESGIPEEDIFDFTELIQELEKQGQEIIKRTDESGNTILWKQNDAGTWNATVYYPNGVLKGSYIVYQKSERPRVGEGFSAENVGVAFDTIPEVVVTPDGVEGNDSYFIAQAQYSPYAQLDIALTAGNTLYSTIENTLNMIKDFETRDDFFTWLGEQLLALDPAGDHLSIDEIKEQLEKMLSKDGVAQQLKEEAEMLAKTPDADWLEVFKHRFEVITGKKFSFYNFNQFQGVSQKFRTYQTYEYQENLYHAGAKEILSLKGSKEDDKYSNDELTQYIEEEILPPDAHKNPNLRKSPRAIALHYLIKVL